MIQCPTSSSGAPRASPKKSYFEEEPAISGFDQISPLPHLIATLFNLDVRSGPPRFYSASSWTWVDHPVSGLPVLTLALFRLGFPAAPRLDRLTLPAPATRRTVLQKVRGCACALHSLCLWGFRFSFTPPGSPFTFPSRYYALSVTKVYLALGWSPDKVSRVSWYFGYCLSLFVFPYGAFTLSGRLSQYRSGNSEYNLLQSLTLQCTHRSLGSFPFARRYSGNRCFFLFLRVLRCFSSPGSLPYVMNWRMDGLVTQWVSPFRNLRIKGYLLSPKASQLSSRLSSALGARHPPYALTCDHNQNYVFSYIPAAQMRSVLLLIIAGISWFFLVLFYWIINFARLSPPDVLLNIYKF